MVDSIDVNIDTPDPTELARGVMQGIGDSIAGFSKTIREGSNEVFMTTTISIMLILGFVTIWRKI